jgi:predicted acyltransferase
MLIDCSIAKRVIIVLGVLQLIGLSFFMMTHIYQFRILNRIAWAIILLVCCWIIIRWYPINCNSSKPISPGNKEIAAIFLGSQKQIQLPNFLSVISGTVLVRGMSLPGGLFVFKA